MCNRDCFNCIYDDCIVDDISTDERKAIYNRDLKTNENKRLNYYWNNHEHKLELARARYKKNKEKFKDQTKAYYQKHKEELQEYGRNYYWDHLDERKIYAKEYYQKNKEKIMQRRRERKLLKNA